MSYLVDTDWVIDYLKGKEEAARLLDPLARDGLAISLITYGEILEGIYFGRNRERHGQIFRAFLQGVPVHPLTESGMEHFAYVRGELRAKGQLIGDADLLIAATALEHNLTLITQNTRHFNRIPALRLYRAN